MLALFRHVFVLVLPVAAVVAMPLTARAQGSTQQTCCPSEGSTVPCCIGQWSGPFDIGISCGAGGPSCTSCNEEDEIGHASLIPAGPWKGMVLIWTKCGKQSARGPLNPYHSYIWDPSNPVGTVASPSMDVVAAMTPPGGTEDDSPYCSAHIWILDDQKDPKLLTVGGIDYELSGSPYFGSKAVYWFDPLTQNWASGPNDLPDENYYPSITPYLDGPASFGYLVLGGSEAEGGNCRDSGGIIWQCPRWWTIATTGGMWTTHSDPYRWHQYPRAFLVHDGGAGNVVAAGHTIICEYPPLFTGGPGDTDLNNPYGGNPVHKVVSASQTRAALSSPNPDDVTGQNPVVGGWHYSNAVILQTLKPMFRDPGSYVLGVGLPVNGIYDLDRIIVSGGAKEVATPGGAFANTVQPALAATYELLLGTTASWTVKAPAPAPRALGNLVILPDGSLLAVGGQKDITPGSGQIEQPVCRFDARRFDPGGPADLGEWKTLATRPWAGSTTDPVFIGTYGTGDYSTPRGYHHVACLLSDGSVALMGGRRVNGTGSIASILRIPVSEDTVEIFQPPFVFETGRPKITSPEPLAVMHYGQEYCLKVNDPMKADYACLIGIGSVTHHFDYGQRYIELMVQRNSAGCGVGENIKVWPPPDPAMAPEGYYLLFVVDDRSGLRMPSVKGVFVKLTF